VNVKFGAPTLENGEMVTSVTLRIRTLEGKRYKTGTLRCLMTL